MRTHPKHTTPHPNPYPLPGKEAQRSGAPAAKATGQPSVAAARLGGVLGDGSGDLRTPQEVAAAALKARTDGGALGRRWAPRGGGRARRG